MIKTITKHGIKVIFDTNEVYPDDPGAGTPAMVYIGDYSATLNCVQNEGELEDSRGRVKKLNNREMNFLQSQEIMNLEEWVYN